MAEKRLPAKAARGSTREMVPVDHPLIGSAQDVLTTLLVLAAISMP